MVLTTSSRILADTTREPEERTSASDETLTPQSRFVPERTRLSDVHSKRHPLIDVKVVLEGIGLDAV